jgi:hypothetical protein
MSMPAQPQGKERRQYPRVSIGNYLLRLDPCDGRPPISCVVWDMSESGARLRLAGDVALPPFIDILIGNVVRKARVVWRKSTQIGIEFLEETT